MAESMDVLAAEPQPGRGRSLLAVGLTVAVVLAVVAAAGGAVVAYRALSGGGPQPEKYAPASTFAFAKVDLDPSAGTKVAAYQLARKFPNDVTDKVTDADELRDEALRSIFDDAEPPVDYDRDVKPWLGSRIGVAGFFDSDDDPQVVAIVQVSDAGRARESLAKVTASLPDETSYNVQDDYAILGGSQEVVDEAVAASKSANVTTNEQFDADVDALGGGQVVSAWVDLAKVGEVIEETLPSSLFGGLGSLAVPFLGLGLTGESTSGFAVPGTTGGSAPPAPSAACIRQFQRAAENFDPSSGAESPFDDLSPKCRRQLQPPGAPTGRPTVTRAAPPELTGRVALAVHVDADYVELLTRSVGVRKAEDIPPSIGDAVTGLPDQTVAALGFGGLRDQLDDLTSEISGSDEELVNDALGEVGLSLDDVLGAIGDTITVALGNVPDDGADPLFALRTDPEDADAADRLVQTISDLIVEEGGPEIVAKRFGDDLVVATDAAYADAIGAGGSLGSQDRFTQAVGPLTGSVTALGYVDLDAILATEPDDGGDFAALTSAGFSVVSTGDVDVMRFRLVAD